MPALETIQIELGFEAPDFTLLEVKSNTQQSLSDVKGEKATVMMFICNHCPFVKHINAELSQIAKDYADKGVAFVAICSNDGDKYTDDNPTNLKAQAEAHDFTFPYFYDESQEVAKAYKAVCTPDFSIFTSDLKCAYRGQLDDSRPGNGKPVTGKDIRAALDAIIAGEEVPSPQLPSIGCSIKWRGEAPY